MFPPWPPHISWRKIKEYHFLNLHIVWSNCSFKMSRWMLNKLSIWPSMTFVPSAHNEWEMQHTSIQTHLHRLWSCPYCAFSFINHFFNTPTQCTLYISTYIFTKSLLHGSVCYTQSSGRTSYTCSKLSAFYMGITSSFHVLSHCLVSVCLPLNIS